MTLTVSISKFRNNISEYLSKVVSGSRVILRDEKKNITIVEITPLTSFDKKSFEKSLRKAAGIFMAKNHPEWKTKSDVIKWLRKNRIENQRVF